MNDDQVGIVAALIHTMRDEWSHPSLQTFIVRHLYERDAHEVTWALARAAHDPKAESPGIILADPRYWSGPKGKAPRAEPVDRDLLCSTCSLPEPQCRRRWPDDHDYKSAADHRTECEAVDPLIRAMRIGDLRAAISKTGRMP
jgi:hypothetical protein